MPLTIGRGYHGECLIYLRSKTRIEITIEGQELEIMPNEVWCLMYLFQNHKVGIIISKAESDVFSF